MRARALGAGLVVALLALSGSVAVNVHLTRQRNDARSHLASEHAASEQLTRQLQDTRSDLAAAQTRQRSVEAGATAGATKATATITQLRGQVTSLQSQINVLRESLATATQPVIQQAPAAPQRTKIEALAYCRTLAAQAFPDDAANSDTSMKGILDAYNSVVRAKTTDDCMTEQGYPPS